MRTGGRAGTGAVAGASAGARVARIRAVRPLARLIRAPAAPRTFVTSSAATSSMFSDTVPPGFGT